MKPDIILLDALRIVLVTGLVSLFAWVGVYTKLAPWWRNVIGRTMVIETILIGLVFIPSTLSAFFNFNRLDSRIAGWVDVGLIGLVTPVMIWRVILWLRMAKKDKGSV
jgi:hypothetical protein